MAYTAYGEQGETTRRTIYFSIKDEKEEFLHKVNECIEQLRREEGLADDEDEDDDEDDHESG